VKKAKALGLLRLKLTGILDVFRMHGMDVYIPEAVKAIMAAVKEYEEWRKE